MKLYEVVAWYQKKIGTYDKQQWEKTVEQKIINGFSSTANLKSAKLKTELIDVDLVRGSTFHKAKPKQTLLTVIRLAILRFIFLPLYAQWWVKQTSANTFGILLFLYFAQTVNWALYCYNLHNYQEPTPTIAPPLMVGRQCNGTYDGPKHFHIQQPPAPTIDEHIVSIMELLIPMALSLILSLMHSQIVATNTLTGVKPKRRRCSNAGQNASQTRESRVRRRRKILKNRHQDVGTDTNNTTTRKTSTATQQTNKVQSNINQELSSKNVNVPFKSNYEAHIANNLSHNPPLIESHEETAYRIAATENMPYHQQQQTPLTYHNEQSQTQSQPQQQHQQQNQQHQHPHQQQHQHPHQHQHSHQHQHPHPHQHQQYQQQESQQSQQQQQNNYKHIPPPLLIQHSENLRHSQKLEFVDHNSFITSTPNSISSYKINLNDATTTSTNVDSTSDLFIDCLSDFNLQSFEKKRNVNWQSPVHKFAIKTQEKQQQTSPQLYSTSTKASDTNSIENSTVSDLNGVAAANSACNTSSAENSPTKNVRIDECVVEFYEDLVKHTVMSPLPLLFDNESMEETLSEHQKDQQQRLQRQSYLIPKIEHPQTPKRLEQTKTRPLISHNLCYNTINPFDSLISHNKNNTINPFNAIVNNSINHNNNNNNVINNNNNDNFNANLHESRNFEPFHIRRPIVEDDGFESLNGKSSSGEDNHIAMPAIAPHTYSITPTPQRSQLRLRLNSTHANNEETRNKTEGLRPLINSDKISTSTSAVISDVYQLQRCLQGFESIQDVQQRPKTVCDVYQQTTNTHKKKSNVKKSDCSSSSSADTDEDDDDVVTITPSLNNTSNCNECTTSATEWLGVTTNSECSYSSEFENTDEDCKSNQITDDDLDYTPTTILSPHGTNDRISCTIWAGNEIKKAQMSVLEISSCIIERVERMPETYDYLYYGILFSILLTIVPCLCRLSGGTINAADNQTAELDYMDYVRLLWNWSDFPFHKIFINTFGQTHWERTVLFISLIQRFALTSILFFVFAVAERTFKQRFLYAKIFSHITSSRRARKSNVPHFRLNKVRNIKTWLSVRSYLKKRGPQRSVDVIVSTAFIVTLLLLSFLSVEWLKDSANLHCQFCLEALVWSATIGIFLLRFMTLGNKIHEKYRSISVLITEQINLYLQIEQKPKKKDELMVSNSVLKLAADLLKELEKPFKISGLSANPYLFTTIKVVILSALSGVLSEMLGFKLKLHKIKIK